MNRTEPLLTHEWLVANGLGGYASGTIAGVASRRYHSLLIGERTAEAIKIELGSAYPLDEPLSYEVRGRNLIEGIPKTITISDEEVREAFRVIDLLITPSAFARDEFIKHFGVTPDRIVHSSNGMDLTCIERRPKIPSRKIRFGYVGSIMKTKGVHILVDAFVRASAGRSDLELHVFGSANRWGQEYFDSVKAHLNPGGMFSLYVPLYESDERTLRSELATFLSRWSRT